MGESSLAAAQSAAQESALSSHSSPEKVNKSRLPAGAMTDPNSLYRKLYNRNMDFFLWIIESEPAPYIFKLHVQAMNKNETKAAGIKRSVQALIGQNSGTGKKAQPPKIQVQFFSKKKQFKVFVEMQDSKQAQQFFARTFVMKNLAILDDNF